MSTEQVAADFDEIARWADDGASGADRYDAFLLSLIPNRAERVVDVGCGLGRLTLGIATGGREVLGVDLSRAMIERARSSGHDERVSFVCGDFLDLNLDAHAFDCVVSAAALHHMVADEAVPRMVRLLRPGGRLIIHDLRRTVSVADDVRAYFALVHTVIARFVRTGRPLEPRRLRDAWMRHGARETYLSFEEAKRLAERLLPGATLLSHWMWRYTIVWDKQVS